jgi:hypothetical protein
MCLIKGIFVGEKNFNINRVFNPKFKNTFLAYGTAFLVPQFE